MITTIATVTVFVEDQDRAKAFYTLGFELINDSEMFPVMRWLTVAPKGCPMELTLFPMGGQWDIIARRWASRSASRCIVTT